jgi:hypothetical protein
MSGTPSACSRCLVSPPLFPLEIGSRVVANNCCRDPEPFDWYQRYSGIRDLVNQYVRREDNILMSGAGNSREFPLLISMDRAAFGL